MVDPGTAAASGAAKVVAAGVSKQLGPRPGVRLGGREERRQVYGRFQSAVCEAVAFAQYLRIERRFAAPVLSMKRVRELAAMVRERQSEIQQAYMDMRLVANPGPMASADDALSAAVTLLDAVGDPLEVFDGHVATVATAQSKFTDACRDDLWYLPQWWQIYRPARWRAWRSWWRRRREIGR